MQAVLYRAARAVYAGAVLGAVADPVSVGVAIADAVAVAVYHDNGVHTRTVLELLLDLVLVPVLAVCRDDRDGHRSAHPHGGTERHHDPGLAGFLLPCHSLRQLALQLLVHVLTSLVLVGPVAVPSGVVLDRRAPSR